MSRLAARFATVLVVTALALGACSTDEPEITGPAPDGGGTATDGTGPDDGGAAGTPDPCELITDEEAAAALGQPVGAREVFGTEERECQIGPAEGIDGYLTIALRPGSLTGYEFSKQTMSDTFTDQFREVDGLGEAAFTIGNEVTVFTGDYIAVFFISVGAPGDNLDERALAMARAGTARLAA